MTPTRLYLIRHGQTDWNLAAKLQGQTDIPLNETGRSQALETKTLLDGVTFDAVYSSPLRRALETAQLVTGLSPEQIHQEPNLIEISFGEWEGCNPQQLGEPFAPFFADTKRYKPTTDGETIEALTRRVAAFVAEVKAHHMGQTVLAVSHGAALHALLAHELPTDDFWGIPLNNCAVAILELEGDRFALKEVRSTQQSDYLAKYIK